MAIYLSQKARREFAVGLANSQNHAGITCGMLIVVAAFF